MKRSGIIAIFVAIALVILGIVVIAVGIGKEETVPAESSSESAAPESHHVEYDFSTDGEAGKSSLLTHYEEKSPEHVIGRMYIPDTGMETPIVDTDYYFRRNLDGAYDSGGVPFTTDRTTFMAPDKNCVIYGHRLESREDFGMLRDYLDQEFYDRHKEIYVETDSGTTTWKIISVFTINIAEDSFSYTAYTDLADSQSRGFFLGEIRTRNLIDTGDYGYKTGDEFITLSTCHYETDQENGRLVIVAVRQ